MKRIAASLSSSSGPSLERDVRIFISHSSRDAAEVLELAEKLSDHGLDAWPYETRLLFGDPIWSRLRQQITQSSFFILLVSDDARQSEAVQRELGLALKVRAEQGGFRPIILPVYSTRAGRGELKRKPSAMPIRDFDTGQVVGEFNISNIRGHDATNAEADRFDFLLSCLRPSVLLVSPDAHDEQSLSDWGFFKLYHDLFSEEVRVSDSEFMENLRRDDGTRRTVVLPGGRIWDWKSLRLRKFDYEHISVFALYMLYEKSIAFSFITYTPQRQLMFGSYIGVQECWRSDGTARRFSAALTERLAEAYPGVKGLVFEVEKFDPVEVGRIISYLEVSREKSFACEADMAQIKNFLRIAWFESSGARFFISAEGGPLSYVQPCLDPDAPAQHRAAWEQTQWLGWMQTGNKVGVADPAALWRDVVDYVMVEMIAKAQAFTNPDVGYEYLRYVDNLKRAVLNRTGRSPVALGKIIRRKDSNLLRRWAALDFKVAM